MAFLVLLWPFLVWLVFLFMASQEVRNKLTMPDSLFGRVLLSLFAVLLMFGYGAARFFIEGRVYFLTPFLILGTAFLFLYNSRIRGFVLAGFGFMLNSLVMMSNGFKMPMLAEFFPLAESAVYSPITKRTILPWLADCLVLNISSRTLVFSAGDVLIAIGLLTAVVHLTRVLVNEKVLTKTPNKER